MNTPRMAKGIVAQDHRQTLLSAMRTYLPAALFSSGLSIRSDARWTPRLIVWAAVLMAWSAQPTLEDRLMAARRCLIEMFPARRRPGRSYQGFVHGLVRWTPILLERVCAQLRARMAPASGPLAAGWRIAGWLVFAADGSKFDLPRTEAHEAAFGRNRRSGPKLWLTTLWHMGLGLPWGWRIGGTHASEREHLRQMMDLLPVGSLLVADAGFTGYDLLRALHKGERHFLIRVGANVRLLRKLGYAVREHDGIVYLWPAEQRKADHPPLVLRLIRLHNGREEVCLLSSVLERAELSDRLACELYRRRWGVEVFYRSMKQTLDRRKMRSRAAEPARCELHWSVVGLWLMGLMSVSAIAEGGGDPGRLSVANALRVCRDAMAEPRRPGRRGLLVRLRRAVRDNYRRTRPKQARDWPHKKKDPRPGRPKIRNATPAEVRAAQRLSNTHTRI